MNINVNEAKLVEKINAGVNIPYAPESTEAAVFKLGVEAATNALVNLSKNLDVLADYGITVTDQPNPVG